MTPLNMIVSPYYSLYVYTGRLRSPPPDGIDVLQLEAEEHMLATILKKTMQEKDLSSHTAADAIGVSHTTILRALRGDKIDVDTIVKIANYLNVRPSELLNSMSDTSLADQIAVLLTHSPELENQFKKVVGLIQAGETDEAALRDVVSYALYKFQGVSNASTGHTRRKRGGSAKRN
jgi:transcriptional regulator with XRE-family HTH domain